MNILEACRAFEARPNLDSLERIKITRVARLVTLVGDHINAIEAAIPEHEHEGREAVRVIREQLDETA